MSDVLLEDDGQRSKITHDGVSLYVLGQDRDTRLFMLARLLEAPHTITDHTAVEEGWEDAATQRPDPRDHWDDDPNTEYQRAMERRNEARGVVR